jgi:hypothetical protein
MDASGIRSSVLGVLGRVLFYSSSSSKLLPCWCCLLSSAPAIADEPWPETMVVCSGGGVTWTGDISYPPMHDFLQNTNGSKNCADRV